MPASNKNAHMDLQLPLGERTARRSPPPVERQGSRLADGGDHAEVTDGAAESQRPQDRTAIGIEHQNGPLRIGVFGECLEFARRVGRDIPHCGNPDAAIGPQTSDGPSRLHSKSHGCAAAFVGGVGGACARLGNATCERERAREQSEHADPHQWRFADASLVTSVAVRLCPKVYVPVLKAAEIRVQPENGRNRLNCAAQTWRYRSALPQLGRHQLSAMRGRCDLDNDRSDSTISFFPDILRRLPALGRTALIGRLSPHLFSGWSGSIAAICRPAPSMRMRRSAASAFGPGAG